MAEGTPATFRVIVNPLVTWIWIGGLIALTGAGIALWPARRGRRALAGVADPELEALKEAKYREIRDAELDHAAGKLSDEDLRPARRRAAQGGGRDPRPRQRQRRGCDAAGRAQLGA